MGYYPNEPPQEPQKQKGGWVLPIVIALGVGLLLFLVIAPNLFGQNAAIDEQPDNENAETNDKDTTDGNIKQETVRVDVSTQITDIVEEVSPAVVGVTNIQMRSD